MCHSKRVPCLYVSVERLRVRVEKAEPGIVKSSRPNAGTFGSVRSKG